MIVRSRLVESIDSIAADAAARIADAVRPWRIVLFGSRARGDAALDSDYDFYIEVDADINELRAVDARVRDSLYDRGFAFDVKVAQRGSLERRRDDPGTIEWDVAREGTVLFAHPSAPVSIAPETRVREPSREPPESVGEWVESAERDERHRDLLQLQHDYWPEICWLSQQMCEKFMKALLVSHFVRPERTHDLSALLGTMRTKGIDIGVVDAECKLFTRHASTPRYPTGLGLTEQDARDASAAAERIVSAVRAKLRR